MRIGNTAGQVAATRWLPELMRSGVVLIWQWIAVAIGYGLSFVEAALSRIVLHHAVVPAAVFIGFLVVGAGYAGYALSRRSPPIGGFAFFAGALLFGVTFFGAFAASQSDSWERGGILLVAISLSLIVLASMSASRWVSRGRSSKLADIPPAPLPLREPRESKPRVAVPRPVPRARPIDLRFVLDTFIVLFWHWMVMVLQLIVLFIINSAALYFWHHHVPYAEYYFAAVQGVTAFFTGIYLRRRHWSPDDPAFAAGALLFIASFVTFILAISSPHHMEPEAFIALFDVPILMQIGLRTTW